MEKSIMNEKKRKTSVDILFTHLLQFVYTSTQCINRSQVFYIYVYTYTLKVQYFCRVNTMYRNVRIVTRYIKDVSIILLLPIK